MQEEILADENTTEFGFKPTYIVLALDTHESMFISDGYPSAFCNCIRALYRLVDALLLRPERGYSPFSVMLFDKEEKSILIDFKDNAIERFKLLQNLSKMTEEELKIRFMRSSDVHLNEFLQFSKKNLKDISTNYFRRRILFITNDPDPVKSDASKRFTALNEAETLLENEITLELIVTKENFDYELFYNEFLLKSKSPYNVLCEDEEGLFHKFISTVLLRLSQRKMCFFPFKDDTSKYISIIRKSYMKKNRILNNTFVSVDGTPVLRKYITTEEGGSAIELNYYLSNLDGKTNFPKITFNLNEKLLCEENKFRVGLTLLYICHRLTGLGETIGEPCIIEEDSSEELPFFSEFWQYCVNVDKVLVCAKVLKEGGTPRAVELVPKFINRNRIFIEKTIPSSDELFEPEINLCREEIIPSEELKKITQTLIESLTIDFDSSFLKNKAHINKMSYLKSKILEQEREQEVEQDERIDGKIDSFVGEFSQFFPQPKGNKRKMK